LFVGRMDYRFWVVVTTLNVDRFAVSSDLTAAKEESPFESNRRQASLGAGSPEAWHSKRASSPSTTTSSVCGTET
jgi:hypothetical protein